MAEECNDKKCFMHSNVSVRGGRMEGVVVSSKAKNTVIIERPLIKFLSKYKRWARECSHIVAHNPVCIQAKAGDHVVVGETRKLSKTKAWTVLEVLPFEGAKQ